MEDSKTTVDNAVTEDPASSSKELNLPETENMIVDETPSGSKDLSKTLPEDAFNNFIQGKRHMLVEDYTFAVQSLATACELYVQHYGELALECGEVYFLYGKSLIRLAQQQSGILGDAINKVTTTTNDEDDEEEGESSEEEEKEAENQSGEDKEKEQNGSGNGSAAEENEAEAEEKEPSESTDSPQAVENNSESKDLDKENEPEADVSVNNETANEEAQEPEEDDLELAWNSLETAKTIFSKQGEDNKDAQLKIAEILQLLAEISMETDSYPAAINDLKSCLCIQRKFLSPDDRLIAHTYYEMGLAHMMQKVYDGALENFMKTLEIFQLRRDNLEKTPVQETVGGFEAADRQKDIEEIDGIITDIREKIEDTKELARTVTNELQEAIIKKEKEIKVDYEKNKPESNKPVSNITHLLKRKKPDEEDKESETKRIKISNGDATVSK